VKRTIFAVEDDPDISRLVKHHLESAGITTRVFPSSKGVIAEATRQHPSAFLLDIMIPGEDGMELCRQIRAISELAPVPVIFLTAKTEESDRLAGFDLGADDYITKPFSPRELVARVKAVLRRFEPAALAALSPIASHPWKWPSMVFALDLLAWDLFLGLSMLFAARVFDGGGLQKHVRMTMNLSGTLCMAGLLGPVSGEMRLQGLAIVGYAFVFPIVCLLLATMLGRTATSST